MPTLMICGRAALLLLLFYSHGAVNAAYAVPVQTSRASAQAAEPSEPASRSKPKILHLPSPSDESTAQRDRRLTRECRGRPNAGACLGYALPRPRARAERR